MVGVDDEEFGERLKAFVVLKGDAELSADEVKAHVKSNLARYKDPREVEFLELRSHETPPARSSSASSPRKTRSARCGGGNGRQRGPLSAWRK